MPRVTVETRIEEDDHRFIVAVDGERLEGSWAIESRGRWYAVVNDDSPGGLVEIPLRQLRETFIFLKVRSPSDVFPDLIHGGIAFWRDLGPTDNEPDDPHFEIVVRADLQRWSNLWSFADFVSAFGIRLNEAGFTIREDDIYEADTICVVCPGLLDHDLTLSDLLKLWCPRVETVVETTLVDLRAAARKDSVLTFFDFPTPISSACQQYLLYFVQFLRDLGIEADAELKQEAHRVMFSVKPTSGSEALERIREALDAYLALPESPEALNGAGDDAALQQLRANVYHLQGQLALSSAIIQAKDATIQALTVSQFRYQQLLLGSGPPSDQDAASVAESEPLVGDVVSVTRYKGKGLIVDLPKILRRLKRTFD